MKISQIRKGDSLSFAIPGYFDSVNSRVISKDEGWSLKFYVKGGANSFSKDADADWKIDLSSADTGGLTPATCSYFLVASKAGEVVTIDEGTIFILASGVTADGTFDGRSFNKKMLDAIRDSLFALASGGAIKEYDINGKSVKKFTFEELVKAETQFAYRVQQEEQRKHGGRSRHRVSYVRFK